jgi:hypothetical protein
MEDVIVGHIRVVWAFKDEIWMRFTICNNDGGDILNGL